MKKIISTVMAFCMCLGVFAGCSKPSAKTEEGDLVVAFIRGSQELTDTAKVEAKVSAMVKEKLGFGIKFKQVNAYAQPDTYSNWLGAQEEIDLLNIVFADPLSYAKDKRVREIDSLLTEENAPYALELLETNPSLRVTNTDGKTYGLGTVETATGYGGSYIIRQDVLEAIGLYGTEEGQYEDQERISYEDLDKIFAAIKANPETAKTEEGKDVYPTGNLSKIDVTGYFTSEDPLSTTKVSGVLENTTTTTVTNYYASEDYKKIVNKMGEWQEKGYVHPDAATTDSTTTSMFENGQFIGCFLDAPAKLRQDYDAQFGCKFVQLQLQAPRYYYGVPPISWLITSISKRPV